MESVLCLGIITSDGDLAPSKGLLGLWPSELADGNTGGDGHDCRSDEIDGGHTESDIGCEDGSSDSGESRSQGLRIRQFVSIVLDTRIDVNVSPDGSPS